MEEWNLRKPFLFRDLKEASYDPKEYQYSQAGLELRALLDACRDGDVYQEFCDMVCVEIDNSLVAKGVNVDRFGTLEVRRFIDGPIRAKIVIAACQLYMKFFVSTRDCFNEFVASVPGAYFPTKPSELELSGVIYREPGSEDLVTLIPVLGMLAEDMMIEMVRSWVNKMAVQTTKQLEAETLLNEMMRNVTVTDNSYTLSRYLNETKVIPAIIALVFIGCMRNA